MYNATIYCLCLHNKILPEIKKVGYVPVGLGDGKFSEEWIKDDSLINIELVDQREYGCVISYDLGPCSFSPKSTYEIITCGECFILVNTIINLGIKA